MRFDPMILMDRGGCRYPGSHQYPLYYWVNKDPEELKDYPLLTFHLYPFME